MSINNGGVCILILYLIKVSSVRRDIKDDISKVFKCSNSENDTYLVWSYALAP